MQTDHVESIRAAFAEVLQDALEPLRDELSQLRSELRSKLPDDPEMTAQDVAAYTGTNKSHWDHLRLEGRGPKFIQKQKGGAVRYRRSDVDVWLNERGAA
ncbi:MAG TPA: helix-turn-helix domain-containing protein [Rhodothermales bacterium]|nr:helix-turn-helix domain-containing protein [Rhodothermales bacterium]